MKAMKAVRTATKQTIACLVAVRTAFMAFIGAGAAAFRMALVATKVCSLASLLTAFIAFMAAARIAFVGTIACLVAVRTAFMAFIGAGAAAFRMAFVATKVCSLASL